jgi:hypothetical protein
MCMRRLISLFRELGFDPTRTLKAIFGIHRYVSNLIRYLLLSKNEKITLSPIFGDFNSQAGSADGHYFWQDLICAQWINENNPLNHLDIGSRVDGFIAHLLSSREVTLVDLRPLENNIPNLRIISGSAQQNLVSSIGKFHSVSSLHCIEHFGLGRYKDPLDPQGHISGLINIAECVENGGFLYLSFPIGLNETQFNAQRLLNPISIVEKLQNFELDRILLIPWKGSPRLLSNLNEIDLAIKSQAVLLKLRKID